MIKNVLVFPCGSEIGFEVHRSLAYSSHFKLFGGSSVPDHGEFVFANYIPDLPYINDPSCIDRLNEVIAKHDIQYIIPAHDDAVVLLAQAQAEGTINCEVIGSPAETCVITRSKLKTYKHLTDHIAIPEVYQRADITEQNLPVFLKPEVGQGSKGTHRADTMQELDFYLDTAEQKLLILEFLPGKEYTVDCFTDKDGTLQFCEGRQRQRILNGISVNSVTVKDTRFKEMADTINEQLTFRGVWFFQVKERTDGQLVLMEVAPRIAGTMGLVRAKGVNMTLLSLFDRWGFKTSIIENKGEVVIDRALENKYRHDLTYKKVYIDFDDLIIVRGKVNPLIMAFIFQCVNNGVTLHLITRHKKDIQKSLEEYHLAGIFDEVIHVKEGDHKHTYITGKDAIFIDDSFSERKIIAEECGIPVFDGHMIESLMTKD